MSIGKTSLLFRTISGKTVKTWVFSISYELDIIDPNILTYTVFSKPKNTSNTSFPATVALDIFLDEK